jgi:hypothetical protein
MLHHPPPTAPPHNLQCPAIRALTLTAGADGSSFQMAMPQEAVDQAEAYYFHHYMCHFSDNA